MHKLIEGDVTLRALYRESKEMSASVPFQLPLKTHIHTVPHEYAFIRCVCNVLATIS